MWLSSDLLLMISFARSQLGAKPPYPLFHAVDLALSTSFLLYGMMYLALIASPFFHSSPHQLRLPFQPDALPPSPPFLSEMPLGGFRSNKAPRIDSHVPGADGSAL